MLRQEASKCFRRQKKERLKDKIDELETKSKTKNMRHSYMGISNFKKGYQPSRNRVKEEKDPLVADYHRILARWRNHISQLFEYIWG
jgi:hypothetical protein